MANMQKLLKQAQKMQSQMMKAQEDLAQQEFVGTSGGGMVTVTINGSQEMKSIKLNPEVVDKNDVEMLEDLIIAAAANAQEQAKAVSEKTFGAFSGGLNIPGLG